MYGLGNWGPDPLHRNSVADHVGMKGGPECQAHYYSVYVDTDTFPLPKPAPEMAFVSGSLYRIYAGLYRLLAALGFHECSLGGICILAFTAC